MNKAETAEKHGEEQVKIWRRSFDIPPPAMEKDHPYYENIVKDPRYADGPSADEFPMFESLKLTIERTLPYWNNTIVPQVQGDPNQNLPFQMAITLKLSSSDPMLVKPKCV